MKHLDAAGNPGYDLNAFRPVGGHMPLHGGGGKSGSMPQAERPPQSSKSPSANVFRQNNANAVRAPGTPHDTLLTGSSGIKDSEVSLGKNTLLGE